MSSNGSNDNSKIKYRITLTARDAEVLMKLCNANIFSSSPPPEDCTTNEVLEARKLLQLFLFKVSNDNLTPAYITTPSVATSLEQQLGLETASSRAGPLLAEKQLAAFQKQETNGIAAMTNAELELATGYRLANGLMTVEEVATWEADMEASITSKLHHADALETAVSANLFKPC